MWRITGFSSYFLTEQLRKRQLQYSTAISGKQEQEPRWKECIDLATGSLSTGSGALYVRKYFKKESKASALQMVNAIKVEFEEILKTVPWMDETTRTAGLSKVKSMVTHIGYPDELMDDNKLTDFYKTVKVDEDKYLESILSINIFGTDRAFKKLREPVNKTDWITHSKPAVVNAFYSSIENSIRELILLWFSGQPAHKSSSQTFLNWFLIFRIPRRYSSRSILLSRTTKVSQLWSYRLRHRTRNHAWIWRSRTSIWFGW